MSLSHVETRSLLCKYFAKVVDLRDSSKKMEQQLAELEAQCDDQTAHIRKLATALKHTQLEVRRHHHHHSSSRYPLHVLIYGFELFFIIVNLIYVHFLIIIRQ